MDEKNLPEGYETWELQKRHFMAKIYVHDKVTSTLMLNYFQNMLGQILIKSHNNCHLVK